MKQSDFDKFWDGIAAGKIDECECPPGGYDEEVVMPDDTPEPAADTMSADG